MSKKPQKVVRSRKSSFFAKKVSKGKSDEKVMVVSRNDMFSYGGWHGIKTDDVNKYTNLISRKHKFLERSKAENDPSWQQIIPYLIFETNGKYFVMQRRADHTDKRLANKFSIGIGGHINEKDIKGLKEYRGNDLIMQWARREFEEEVNYEGKYGTIFLGLINDDSNDIGLAHLGLVIQIKGDSNNISVKDEHKLGKLEPLSKIDSHYKHMETWSQIVYDQLKKWKIKPRKSHSRLDRESLGTESSGRSGSEEPSGSMRRMSDPRFREDDGTAMKQAKGIIGILPDWVIADYVAKNKIQISPLPLRWRENIDQVSIDFHLGNKLKLFRSGAYRFVDTRRGLPDDAMEEVELKNGDPFILEPGVFAIATTKEILKLPSDILGRLEGKSSLARLGILVHSTAARFDPGWNGAPVLELGNLGPKPAILYCGMPICAFTFEKLASPVRMRYEGSRSDRYSGSKIPVASRIEKHGKKK